MQRGFKVGLYGLVLAGLLGGTAAWVTAGKTVHVQIDGQDQSLHTTAANVGGVLSAAHVFVGDHDLVAPDVNSSIRKGTVIVVNRGHLLHLSVDGQARDVWVNATSVNQALGQLGYGTKDLVSVSRSKRLDSGATQLAITSPKLVTFKVAGKSIAVLSAGPNVYQALRDGAITLAANDRISVPGGSAIHANQVITVQRITYGKSSKQVVLPYKAVQQKDPTAYVGTKSTVTAGKNGTGVVSYQLIYVDGVLSGKVPSIAKVLTAPINQLTKLGTKPIPVGTVLPAGAAQQLAAGMVTARGWGSDQMSCLTSLWNKESGWRTNAANSSGAYGIPQALPGSKMATVGADWRTSAATQITWGLNYIAGVYGTPCAAWSHSQAMNWY